MSSGNLGGAVTVIVLLLFGACTSTGDKKLSQEDNGTRMNDFGAGVCGNFCAASETAGCIVPSNCEVNCTNARAATPSACASLEDTYLTCAGERERAACGPNGYPVIDVCLPEALDLHYCLPPGTGFCAIDPNDPFDVCFDRDCCETSLRCDNDATCAAATADWYSCVEVAIEQADYDACDQAYASSGALSSSYLGCFLACLEEAD